MVASPSLYYKILLWYLNDPFWQIKIHLWPSQSLCIHHICSINIIKVATSLFKLSHCLDAYLSLSLLSATFWYFLLIWINLSLNNWIWLRLSFSTWILFMADLLSIRNLTVATISKASAFTLPNCSSYNRDLTLENTFSTLFSHSSSLSSSVINDRNLVLVFPSTSLHLRRQFATGVPGRFPPRTEDLRQKGHSANLYMAHHLNLFPFGMISKIQNSKIEIRIGWTPKIMHPVKLFTRGSVPWYWDNRQEGVVKSIFF